MRRSPSLCVPPFFLPLSQGLLVASDGTARAASLVRARFLLQMGQVDAARDYAKFQACARSRCGNRVPSGCVSARWRQACGRGPGASVRAEEARPLALAHALLRAGHTDAAPNRARFRACLITRRGDRVRAVGSSGGERAKACGRGPGASVRAVEAVSLARASDLLQMGHVDAACDCARFQVCACSRCGGRVPSGCVSARWRQVVTCAPQTVPRARFRSRALRTCCRWVKSIRFAFNMSLWARQPALARSPTRHSLSGPPRPLPPP